MNDEETVALIAGGHTFGKTHGAGPASNVGPDPEERRPRTSRASAGRAASARASAATRSPAASKSPGPPRRPSGATTSSENLFGFEWELTKSPAGAQQWVAKGAGATIPEPGRSVEEARADDAHDRPRAAVRPGVRKDLAAVHGESGSVRRRVRPGVVQADAPRHGPAGALSRPGGSGGRTHLAGSDSGGESSAGRCEGHRRAEEQDPGCGTVGLATGFDGLGVGLDVPRLGQARRRERRPHSSRPAEGLGSQPAGPTGEGAQDARRHSERVQQGAQPAARRFRSPT